ncbi:MAG: EAL domain-containing protein [Bacteroidia bacterium]|nr:EAL domain-containing protein [Methylotenera sp.]
MFTQLNSNLAKFALVALAYFITAKFGLMVPYKESIATLIWLPTGIAVGALIRWGNISLPAIFVAVLFTELSVGIPLITSIAIAISNTLAPFFCAYLLKKSQFNHSLIRQKDIALMILAALVGMLISATGGVTALYLNGLVAQENIMSVWFIWWIGDTIGVLLALPLVLNISKDNLRVSKQQYYQLFGWLIFYALCEFVISALEISLNKQFMLSIFLILPILIWASMNFGIVGGSLVVISLSSVAVWVTSHGYGEFYSTQASEGMFSLWVFIVTLVVMMLLISVMQSEKSIAEKALRINDRKLRSVIDGALDGIITIDNKGAIIEFNPAAERIFGYQKEQVIGKPLGEVIVPPAQRSAHAHKHQQFVLTGQKHIFDKRVELTAMRADGSEFPVELTLTSLNHDGLSLVTGFIRDLTQQKQAQQEIENFAYYDGLTGLPNRRLLIDRFERAVVNCKRANTDCALIFIDLDHFKNLNDTKGHDIGDQLLIEVANRIKNTIRAGDTVARLSGDEFIVIVENLDHDPNITYFQASDIAEKLLTALNKSYQLDMYEFSTTASLGIALFNDEGLSFADQLRHADNAMYQSKAAGRNTYRFYDAITEERVEKNLALETALNSALKNNEFHLNFQSIVDVNKNIIGAEVLLRWTHPELGNISPAEFIPIAEKNNQIIKIGHWVIQQACEQIKIWENSPVMNQVRLSINISAKQFLYMNFVQELRVILEETGINPDYLKLELTETAVIDNIDDAIYKINILRKIGVRLVLDDFGIGQSSLIYLKKLPVTQIKIDQSFVKDVLTDTNDAAIIKMILAIGRTIRCNIVAEGVESVEQFQLLKKFGCRFFQGYYFSKPVKVNEFERLVEANK